MHQKLDRNRLLSLIKKALKETNPRKITVKSVKWDAVEKKLSAAGTILNLHQEQKVWVFGAGKASGAMAEGLEEVLNGQIQGGAVIVPKGSDVKLRYIQRLEGSHPLPDEHSFNSTSNLLKLMSHIPEGAPVIFLLSGGTSALLCKPVDDISLENLRQIHQLLLNSGADIHEMNIVRTAFSAVKGGQLLRFLAKSPLIDLVISDVPGNEFQTIGSGPTTSTTIDYVKTRSILKQQDIWHKMPKQAQQFLNSQAERFKRIIIKPHKKLHEQHILSSAEGLAEKVADLLIQKGVDTVIHRPAYNCSIEELETLIMDSIKNEKMNIVGDSNADRYRTRGFIYFGESSVNVTGNGKGGRNQEIALRILRHLDEDSSVLFASIGTDGVDGPTDAAGAIIDGESISELKSKQLNVAKYLEENDSYNFFSEIGGLIKTGPTGNNLMDLQVLIL